MLRTKGIAKEKQKKIERIGNMETKTNRNQLAALIVTVVVILCMFVGVILSTTLSNSNHPKEVAKTQAREAAKNIKDSEKPINMNKDGGIPISKNGYNNPVSGVPTIGVYSDSLCPGCGSFNRSADRELISMMEAGQINLEIYPMSFLDTLSSDHYSSRVMGGIYYIADHDSNPQHLVEFINKIFAENFQPSEGEDYKPVSNEKLAEQAVAAGVPEDVAKVAFNRHYLKWQKVMNGTTPDRKELWNVSGSNAGAMTTPTVTINGKLVDIPAASKKNLEIIDAVLKSIGLNKKDIGSSTVKPKLDDSHKPNDL